MFQHILFPTDTSELSNSGFRVAIDVQRKYGCKITLLNIHEEFMSREEMQYLRVSQQNYQEIIRQHAVLSRENMEALVNEFDAGEFCEIMLREGRPRQEIIRISEEIGADLIVMSSNGRSGFVEQLLGSVAEHVVRHAKMSVLVVKV